MTSAEFDNLVRIGKLKREPPSTREQEALLQSASLRLAHDRRNLAEYTGLLEHDERLLTGLIAAAEQLREAVLALQPLEDARSIS